MKEFTLVNASLLHLPYGNLPWSATRGAFLHQWESGKFGEEADNLLQFTTREGTQPPTIGSRIMAWWNTSLRRSWQWSVPEKINLKNIKDREQLTNLLGFSLGSYTSVLRSKIKKSAHEDGVIDKEIEEKETSNNNVS